MLESLDRDFEASCMGEELRILAVRRSASRQGCRWRHDPTLGVFMGIPESTVQLVLFQQPRLTHTLPDGDERYGIRFDIVDYLRVRSFPINLLGP